MSDAGGETADIDDYDDAVKRAFHRVGPSQNDPQRIMADKAVLSSVNLQMALYYNLLFSLVYAWHFVLAFRWKSLNFSGLRVSYFTPMFFTLWAVTEIGRIYVGYSGNLTEDTPGMAAFLFLTVFPQLFIIIYMLVIQYPMFGIDKIYNGIMLFMLLVELVLAWRTIGVFIKDKTARFSVEHGEEHGKAPQEDRTEVQAMERYVREGEEDTTAADDGMSGLVSAGATLRSTRGGGAGRATGDIEMTRSLGSTAVSFGGPSVVPYAAHKAAPRGAGAPRGSAPLSAASTLHHGSAFPASASSALTGSAETREEKDRRRARDRAIIEGRLVPTRHRDAEELAHEAELEMARAQLAASTQAITERPARPTIGTLTSPAQSSVRIPHRPQLQTPTAATGGNIADERRALADSKRQ